MPTPEAWLQSALTDASRHGGDGVRPVLDALANALTALREAEWNADASSDEARPPGWSADATREGTVSSRDSRG
jgi:hypothetical protein